MPEQATQVVPGPVPGACQPLELSPFDTQVAEALRGEEIYPQNSTAGRGVKRELPANSGDSTQIASPPVPQLPLTTHRVTRGSCPLT